MSETLDTRAMALLDRALQQPSDGREVWVRQAAADDPALLSRVLALLDADRSSGSALKTGGAAHDAGDAPLPERIGAYRVVALIGQGGMGAVYRAERDAGDFEHTAAIKVIRPGILSQVLEARFRQERQVLARLNHPNIARLFDGGAMPDGSPYFVMEHVGGAPILAWANSAKADTATRVSLLRAVAEAVRHAHQNLIIHRDITPANVLVTRDGVPKLIDFGISRPPSEETAAVPSGSVGISLSFTPGYAAPERSAGQAASTLSDIYSLGRLLADLLQGQPRDRDLDAIAAKAAALDPVARHASADALIADLDAWAELRPVSARAGEPGYAFARYLRRRRGLVAGLAAGFVALSGALGVTLYQFREAQAARAAANERFEDLSGLALALVGDIYNEVERVPGALKARQVIAETARTYLEKVASAPEASQDLRINTAGALGLLAQIYASPKGSSLSDWDTGKAIYEQARAMYERELAATPDDPDLLLRAGKHFYYEAEIAISPDNDIPRAHDLLDRSEALLRRRIAVAGEGDGDEEGEISLIFTLNARSEIHMMENRLPDAATVLEAQIPRVLALLEAREARGDAPDENLMRLYNSSLRMLGQVYTYQNRALAAIEVLDKAVAHYPRIEALKPGDTYAMRGKVLAYSRRAYAHLMAGQLEPAIADYEVALAISRERMALEPGDEDTRFMYNAHRGELALALGQLGRFDEAEAIFLEGLAYQREQLAKNPDSAWNRRNLWVQHYQMVLHYQRAGQTDRMCTAFRDMTQVTAERVARNAMTETDTNGWTGVLAQYTPLCGEPPPG